MDSKHTSSRWLPRRGELLRKVLKADPVSEYLVYIPNSSTVNSHVLVSVHGLYDKSWYKQAEMLVPLCERQGFVLLAPFFNDHQYPDYQRLGRKGRGNRADLFLHLCLQELNTFTGANTAQLRFFGHSGGAQFVHRYLMAYPHRVEFAIVSAAGWYTFPDPALKFPYGIRATASLPSVIFNPEAYLKVPIIVLVGTDDTKQSKDLRNMDRINKQQGFTRIDRARNWVAAMQAQARAYGISSQVSILELAETGHSLTDLGNEISLIESVMHFNRSNDSFSAPAGMLN